ncbi:MAG: restriction endonuclease [Planctomycetes bacterium]|nr:restriction endonuclease [Planctomycetota bacterium]
MARRTKRPPTAGANHLEWLRLVEVSGPFLSLPVLKEALPQGLEVDDRDVRAELKAAHAEWTEKAHDRAYHTQWIRFVLGRALELGPEVLVDGPGVPANLRVRVAVHHEDLRPDFAVLGFAESGERPTRLVVQVFDAGTDLERPVEDARWKASPVTRMVELLRGLPDGGPTLGLVTNGEQWVLVSAPRKGTTTFVTWHASLWFEEKITLQAFRTLLGARRVFGPVDETLERLSDRSAEHQHDVTIQLGLQVREAIELLVRRIDELDRRSGRTLLEGVTEKQVYEAAVTVMMRLVFLFYLEEQADLYFPVAKSNFYQRHYALSPLGASLRAEADRLGPDVLERRTSAWCRLLATFRAIHGGVGHVDMRLPAYGGHLFDPDRFPFLEGRKPGQGWRTNAATPLAIDDATVLFVLEALQVLRVRDGGANGAETRRLSFRELGVEQIGNVYESLFDHTAKRADDAVVSLKASKGEEPEIELRELEQRYDPIDTSKLVSFVKERTGRTEPSIAKDLEYTIDEDPSRWLLACGNDSELYGRVKPVAGLVREDRRKQPVVYPKDSIYVTAGADRRSTGTHYTPPSLTEPVVRYALEPLVYEGPAEGKPESEWVLKSAREILALRVCDLACGSGAFLVQACRYLAERLVEAWALLEAANPGRLLITPEGDLSTGAAGERIIPKDDVERQAIARRVVADRCLYGVDINPMAVEMAKLSLWLTTLQREKPFGFLDHSIRHGDSLVGVTDTWQLEKLNLTNRAVPEVLAAGLVRSALARARTLRIQLGALPTETVEDVERKAALLQEAESQVRALRAISDSLIAAYLDAVQRPAGQRPRRLRVSLEQDVASDVKKILDPTLGDDARRTEATKCSERALAALRAGAPLGSLQRTPLHWLLEFPEVFEAIGDDRGFDAFVGNPPFRGGKLISGDFGQDYREFLVAVVAQGTKGNADLVGYMYLRACSLLRSSGTLGLLATNSIAQGETRDVSLGRVVSNGFTIYRAIRSSPWPGAAALEVSHTWIRKGPWQGAFVLDACEVSGITAQLSAPGRTAGMPLALAENRVIAFQGSIPLGDGFVLDAAEAVELIAASDGHREVVRPYLNGEDLNSRVDQSPSRWIVDFHDWPLERSAPGSWERSSIEERRAWLRHGRVPVDYPDHVARDHAPCLRILEQRVLPFLGSMSKFRRKEWWLHHNNRPGLYAAIAGRTRAVATARVSKHLVFAWIPSDIVASEQLIVFAVEDDGFLALLESGLHFEWVRKYQSNLETRGRYTPTDCFETFPLPESRTSLDGLGKRLDEVRRESCTRRQVGLTALYNLLHDRACEDEDIRTLRSIKADIDRATLQAYGWGDLVPRHGFNRLAEGERFTMQDELRAEILDRLLALNHSRHAAEVEEEARVRT